MAESVALNTSNQYVKYKIYVTQNSQSVDGNYSNVRVYVNFYRTNSGYTTYGTGTVYCKINGTTYSASVSSSQKITNAGIVLFDTWLNIPHNADGSKDLTVTAWISINAPLTSTEQGFTTALTTIPRASTPTLSKTTFNFGETITITTNRLSNSFTHTVRYAFGTAQANIATGVTNSTSWAVPNSLMTQIPNATSGVGSIIVDTYNGNTLIGTKSIAFTANVPSNVLPTISSITLSEAASGIPSGAGYVKSYSKIRAVTTAGGAYGSTISACSVIIDNLSYSGQDVTSNVLTTAGIIEVSAMVVDSRGRVAIRTQTVTVNEYVPPKINTFTVNRCDYDGTLNEQGEYAKIVYNAEITALNNANTKSFAIKIKKTSEMAYSTMPIAAASYTVIGEKLIAVDTGSSYNIVFEATDSFSTVSNPLQLSTAFTLYNVRANGKGWAFGKVSEKDALEINMVLEILQGVKIKVNNSLVDLDYVEEQGTIGYWFYQKYHSGLAKMWGWTQATYTTAYILGKNETFPIELVQWISAHGTLNSTWWNSANKFDTNVKVESSTTNCNVWVHNPSGNFINTDVADVSIHIVGKWK